MPNEIVVAPYTVGESPVQREARDPRAATSNVSYSTPGHPMVQEWDAASAIRWGYIANTYVWRCVDAISTAIASCPFMGVDPKEVKTVREDAPLTGLLGPPPGGPNPALSPRRLWKWTIAQRLVTGRWCWEKERLTPNATSGRPIGLWPLPSHLVDPVPASSGRHYFQAYTFNRAGSDQTGLYVPGHNKRVDFLPSQVVYDWNPSQTDVRQAESVLQAARLDVSVAVMQDRYDVAFLKNDARPAAVIVHEEFAEREEREAWRQQFAAEHRGVDNAGKPIFVEATPGEEELNRSFHIERLGLTQKDAEFIKRYEAKIRAICIAFGTPLSILGDSSARSFDNAGQEYRNWWEGTLIPLMTEFEDAVNMQLAPDLGREIGKFQTSHVAALMRSSKILSLGGAIPQFVAADIIRRNEVRDELDLEPLDDDDIAAHALMPAPTEDEDEPSTDQDDKVEDTGRDDPADEGQTDDDDDNLRKNLKRFTEYEVRDQVQVTEDEDGRITISSRND